MWDGDEAPLGCDGPNDDDAADTLQERARSGDTNARDELLGRSWHALVGFCQRHVHDVHAAEDLAQDVLVTLSACDAWPAGSFRAWLLRLARNRCLDYRKQRKDGRAGAGSFLGSSYLPPPRTGPGTAVARAEEHEILRRHLLAIAAPKAEVLALRYFDGLRRKEIAEVLGLSDTLVRSRLAEGRKELQQRLEGKR